MKRIALIQGHPDASTPHLCHGLAQAYRWLFRAHSLKSLERNILRFSGIAPVRESLFGMVENVDAAKRARWIDRMRALGAAGR